MQCDASGEHVTGLFPNPRQSGNPLVGQLPASIAKLQQLELDATEDNADEDEPPPEPPPHPHPAAEQEARGAAAVAPQGVAWEALLDDAMHMGDRLQGIW